MAGIEQDANVIEPAVIKGRNIIVLYGSETGNAEDIALELAEMTRRLHFKTTVDEMDNIKLTELVQCQLAIFVTSTAGQGDLPRNTTKFWTNLRRSKLNNTNCLGRLKFTIFGLGDSSYPNVNAAARKLRSRLKQLGATEFFKAGEGDERHENGQVHKFSPSPRHFENQTLAAATGRPYLWRHRPQPHSNPIDSAYLPWSKELREHLITTYPLPEPLQPLTDDIQLPPRYRIVFDMASAASSAQADDVEARFAEKRELNAELSHVDRVRTNLFQKYLNNEVRNKSEIARVAREDEDWENDNPRRFGSLDKDNILTDHYSKYLLKEPVAPHTPPLERMLAIPKSVFAEVSENKRLTPESHWQDVRHIKLNVGLQGKDKKVVGMLPFLAGATVSIYPKNFPEDVQALIDMMEWGNVADNAIDRKKCLVPIKLYDFDDKSTQSLRDILTHNLDITAVPKRSFLRQMRRFTKQENEKERLHSFTESNSQQEFYDYTSRPRRTILEVLQDFPGVRIPVENVFDMFPLIRGREYSICNGASSIGDDTSIVNIEIIAALVEYKTVIRKPRQGLCSRYLKYLKPDSLISVVLNPPSNDTLRPDNMVITRDGVRLDRPLIAVATGTGIAPIRALLSDRRRAGIKAPALVFFGCRNEHADFFFENERQRGETQPVSDDYWGDNVKVIPAFSRDENPRQIAPVLSPHDRWLLENAPQHNIWRPPHVRSSGEKNYVQDQIKKHAYEVGQFLQFIAPPIICVCGNSGVMPIQVREAFEDVLVSQRVVRSKAEAVAWLNNKEKVAYWQEVW